MQGRLPKVAEEEYLLLTGWYRADDDASNSWSNDDELFVCSRCKDHGLDCKYDVVQGVNDTIGIWLRLNQCKECKTHSRKQGCSAVKKGTLARYRWSEEDGWELRHAVASDDCGLGTRRNPKGTVNAMQVERPRRKQRQPPAEPQYDFFVNPDIESDAGPGHFTPVPSSPTHSNRTSPTPIGSPLSAFNDPGLPDPPSPSISAHSRSSISAARQHDASVPSGAATIASNTGSKDHHQPLDHQPQPTGFSPAYSTHRYHSTTEDPIFGATALHALLNEVLPREQYNPTTLAQIDHIHQLIDKGLNVGTRTSRNGEEDQDRES